MERIGASGAEDSTGGFDSSEKPWTDEFKYKSSWSLWLRKVGKVPTSDLRFRKSNLELLPEKVENTGHV